MDERTATVNQYSSLGFSEAEELLERVGHYLPSNYDAALSTADNLTFKVVITGADSAGWTLDGYVIPRLASGNMFAAETTNQGGTQHD